MTNERTAGTVPLKYNRLQNPFNKV